MTDLAMSIRFNINQSNSFILLKYLYKVVNLGQVLSLSFTPHEGISFLKSIRIILTEPAFS